MNNDTFVPLGIRSYDGSYESKYIMIPYIISGSNAKKLTIQIRNGSTELYKQEFTAPSSLSVGKHYWSWDGFDNGGILDTEILTKGNLNCKITAVSQKGNVFTKFKDLKFSYKQVNWVDVRIDRINKKIYVTLRVNLKDGGANGIICRDPILQSPTIGSYSLVGCPWDLIPKDRLRLIGRTPIKSRTRSFRQLEKLAIDGINYYWSRNRNRNIYSNIATGVNINGQNYQVFVEAINTNENSMDDIDLIYNTNNSWMRSGNPNTVTGFISFFGNIISREAICYNVGYIKYSKGWFYQEETNEDIEFKYTAAHEIGHEILKAYGDVYYSYGHKGTVNTITQKIKDDASPYPKSGEMDIMHYFPENPPLSDYNRYTAAEKDVLSLIWLTKMEIEKC